MEDKNLPQEEILRGADDLPEKSEQVAPEEKPAEEKIVFPNEASFMKRVKREAKKLLKQALGEEIDDLEGLKELIQKAKKLEEMTKTEKERLEETLAKLEREKMAMEIELTELRKKDLFTRVASELGVKHLDAGYKLMDWAEVEELTEDEIRRALEKTLERYPFLKQNIQASTVGAGSVRQASGNENIEAMINRETLARMTPEEINKNWQLISRLLSEGKI